MARLKSTQPPPLPAAGRDEPDAGPLPFDVVVDGPRPGREHPGADALWRQLQREIADATMGGEFDVRVCLTLGLEALADWQARRRVWLRRWLADDARVSFD
jgi:hypothetical protein